jgi:hypothetical protein
LRVATVRIPRLRRRMRDADVFGDLWFPDDGLVRFL